MAKYALTNGNGGSTPVIGLGGKEAGVEGQCVVPFK